jgi:hypothetical protein
MTDNGVLLTRDELRELTEIRLAVDSVQRILDAVMQADDVSVSDAASIFQPISRWLGEFTDRVYKRAVP